MYSCPLHNWYSHEAPCPECRTTITTGGDQPSEGEDEAKQEAIAYLNFVDNSRYMRLEKYYWQDEHGNKLTDDQLYTLFQESKKQK